MIFFVQINCKACLFLSGTYVYTFFDRKYILRQNWTKLENDR